MALDLARLREHYASITDEELLSLDRSELVEAAQKCLDDEIGDRQLSPVEGGEPDKENAPDWLDEGTEVLSSTAGSRTPPSPDLTDARNALQAAGIPCFLDLAERPDEPTSCSTQTHIWRVMVPGNFNMQATSVLERDLFNADFDNQWKTHLEMMSDDEVRAMDPRIAFCGLFDRVERVTKTYAEELERRGLTRGS